MPPKPKNKKRLLLLDSHAIIHRAYHAMPDFTSNRGEPTGALYGVATMLFKAVKDFNPDWVIACFDLPEPTHRHKVFEEYKAGRAKADDALVAQLERAKDLFKAFNVPVISYPGFEADDIIGTIVHKTKKNKDVEVIIASGDMDTLQLVEEKRVKVFTLKRGINDTVIYDEKAVEERYGFPSNFLPDFKGLRGDPSDNIPGIQGIGEKTATDLIKNFGSIEEIYKKLKKDKTQFEKKGIKPRIIKLLEEGEDEALFSKELGTIRLDAPIEFKLDKPWPESYDYQKADSFFAELEFRSLRGRLKDLFNGSKPTQKTGEELKKKVEKEPEPQKLIEDNIDPDDLERTKIAFWLLDSNKTNPSTEDLISYANAKSFSEAKQKIMNDLKKIPELQKIYDEIEMPLYPILKKAKERGILIDVDYLKKLSKDYHKVLNQLQKQIWEIAGTEFNTNSPKQLGEILFDKLGIPSKGVKKTKTGSYSTNADVLEKLRDENKIVDLLLEYREYQKLLSTYIDNIPEMLDEENKLHTTFLQTGTSTGRFSSQDPNLQNIPIKTELGRNIRNGFLATKGFAFVALDYSQIDLRAAAILSGDKKLTASFKEGFDIHSAVASEMFGVPKDEVDKEMRRRAKVINFGILYGMGVNALRNNLGKDKTTQADAREYLDAYFAAFPDLTKYLEDTKEFARKNGYTETYFKRRRYFPGIKSRVPFIRAAAERQASNAPIQGTASDIIKIATINIEKELEKKGLSNDIYLVLQIHDELIYEVKTEKLREAEEMLKNVMENALKAEVPLVVSVNEGANWGDL